MPDRLPLLLVAAVLMAGCAQNPARPDPWEKVNRFFYAFDDGLDRYGFEPVSNFYIKVVPRPIRTGIGNGFENLAYADVIINDFLQARWNQGWRDTQRMAINSTIGIAGFFDVASRWGLTYQENDLGVTLGKWGCGPGPYLVLPLFGPSSFRDAPDIPFSFVTDPTFWLDLPWTVAVPLYGMEAIDTRARETGAVRFRNRAAIDPYIFTREAYLRYRMNLIHPGQPAASSELYDQDTEPTTQQDRSSR